MTLTLLLIGVGVWVLAAKIRNGFRESRHRGVEMLGRQLYLDIVGRESSAGGASSVDVTSLPRSDQQWGSSTEFFRAWIQSSGMGDEVLLVGPSYLASPHEYTTELRRDNNAWCVTLDVSASDPDNLPVLFTRNLAIDRLDAPLTDALTEEAPFGREGVVVIYKDYCQSRFLLPAELARDFNPSGATNRVLRP